MATARELLTTVLDGGIPERTPYSVYAWFFEQSAYPAYAEWRPLVERGLGISFSCETVRRVEHGVRDTVRRRIEGNREYVLRKKETDVGSLQTVKVNLLEPGAGPIGWTREEWIKAPEDYTIWQWIVEHTELVPQYEELERAEARAGDHGVTLVEGGRTPAMSINVDWAGTERFCLDIATGVDELFALYDAQLKSFMEETRLIAAGPGRFVRWLENLTISMLGPKRYSQLLMPVYEQAVPTLEAAGKRVMVHYDGALKAIADQIAAAPFHIIESLTEPPEGDMTYAECRAAWPDKVFWANINVGLYALPPDELRRAIQAKRARAGKRGLAFEISEDIPLNWREAVPVVLDTLEELG
jgi:hypothetical protein